MRTLLLGLATGAFISLTVQPATGQSLRFFGNGQDDIDRVKIPIDGPPRPADVGQSDFTIEFWMKALPADYPPSPPACSEGGDSWINGFILLDRDVFGAGDYGDFGVSVYGGRVAFGVAAEGGSGQTLCGTSNVVTGAWRHVAVTRHGATGQLSVFVDGVLERTGSGPPGNASYRDGRATSYANSDPFLVLGAEKHDAGPAYPSYRGWLAELRLSHSLRYGAPYSPATAPFSPDAETAALYHFAEGIGTTLGDASGGASNGIIKVGGTPVGPEWSTDGPFPESPPAGPFRFFTLSPCRLVDTRLGLGALAANTTQVFTLVGECGVPSTARAVSVNMTIVGPGANGNLRLWPADQAPPTASAINYTVGQTRANNAVVRLSAAGALAVRPDQAGGGVIFILDVNGYFE